MSLPSHRWARIRRWKMIQAVNDKLEDDGLADFSKIPANWLSRHLFAWKVTCGMSPVKNDTKEMHLSGNHCAGRAVTERGSKAKIQLARVSCAPSQFCSSSAKQWKPWPWLSRSFVNSCDTTPPRRHVADVPPNGGGVAWHRAPGWNSASLHQCCGHLSPSTDTPHQKCYFFFFTEQAISIFFFSCQESVCFRVISDIAVASTRQ